MTYYNRKDVAFDINSTFLFAGVLAYLENDLLLPVLLNE